MTIREIIYQANFNRELQEKIISELEKLFKQTNLEQYHLGQMSMCMHLIEINRREQTKLMEKMQKTIGTEGLGGKAVNET